MSEHRIKPKHAKNAAKNMPKLVVKGVSNFTLPEMPKMTVALESGPVAGASSKGFGGGAGGGEGGGFGPGRGGGRNMVSFFGGSDFRMAGLVGSFYDLKQDAKGKSRGRNRGRYVGEVRKFVADGWSTSFLGSKFFRAPTRLVISQFCIPRISANDAPAAFNVKVAPSEWTAHYKGSVTAPFSGQFRFVGTADDWLIVRWAGRPALTCGFDILFAASKEGNLYGSGKPAPGTGNTYPSSVGGPPMRCGPWLQATRDNKYAIEVAIGETPGGIFFAFLAFERKEEPGKLYLFRMSGGEFKPTGAVNAGIDYSGGGHVWKPEMSRSGR
jgi:hypothetical protein